MGTTIDPSTGMRVIEATDYCLAVCDPSFFPPDELEGMAPLKHSLHEADWENLVQDISQGKVAVFALESGEAEAAAVKMAVLYEAGWCGLVFRHDKRRGRLLVMRAAAPASDDPGSPSETTTAGAGADAGRQPAGVMARACGAALARLSAEDIAAVLPVLAALADGEPPDVQPWASRETLLEAAMTLLQRLDILAASVCLRVLRRYAPDKPGNGGADDGGDGSEDDGGSAA